MTNIWDTLIAFVIAIAFCFMVFTIRACSLETNKLRSECIKSGISVDECGRGIRS